MSMEREFLTEDIKRKWSDLVENEEVYGGFQDNWRKAVTIRLLENQEHFLTEAPTNNINNAGAGNIDTWDPILISLVRRAMPNLIAYDVCGVQPMTGPTGLIFAMRSHYGPQTGPEALAINEPKTDWSGDQDSSAEGHVPDNIDPFHNNDLAGGDVEIGRGMSTADGEALGGGGDSFREMSFTIEKSSVEAKTRALKAEYSMELAQDLKAIHGLDAETELANILSTEILSEINREVVRLIYRVARLGAQKSTATAGVFDLNTDSNGRWSVERFKGLLFQIERDANLIAKTTRRGRGNFIVTSSDVAAAMSMAGVLDHTPALQTNLNVDDTGNTFAGTIHGRMRVYIDPYFATNVDHDFYCVGYRGSHQYDAGLFYCPYVPLQMVRAVGENNFQPKIGFKTRYGMVSNPFVRADGNLEGKGNPDAMNLTPRVNQYYRIVRVDNLM
jgi:hypothetical protein